MSEPSPTHLPVDRRALRLVAAAALAYVAFASANCSSGLNECDATASCALDTWTLTRGAEQLSAGCGVDVTTHGSTAGDTHRADLVSFHAAVGDVVTESVQSLSRRKTAGSCDEQALVGGSDPVFWCAKGSRDVDSLGSSIYKCAVAASADESADVLGVTVSSDLLTATIQYRVRRAGVMHLKFDLTCAAGWRSADQNFGWSEFTISVP
jgi:hypothetical protein